MGHRYPPGHRRRHRARQPIGGFQPGSGNRLLGRHGRRRQSKPGDRRPPSAGGAGRHPGRGLQPMRGQGTMQSLRRQGQVQSLRRQGQVQPLRGQGQVQPLRRQGQVQPLRRQGQVQPLQPLRRREDGGIVPLRHSTLGQGQPLRRQESLRRQGQVQPLRGQGQVQPLRGQEPLRGGQSLQSLQSLRRRRIGEFDLGRSRQGLRLHSPGSPACLPQVWQFRGDGQCQVAPVQPRGLSLRHPWRAVGQQLRQRSGAQIRRL
ncbi:MAG: DUF4573 domain-containing protein [Proteobacteria bacterium]|nr:DUF4573 domain-containing protein [Pseudomonadota bacterium]